MQTMRSWSLPTAAAVVAATIFFSLSTMALPAASAIVEHTFVVIKLDPLLFHGLDLHCTWMPSFCILLAGISVLNLNLYAGEPDDHEALVQGDSRHRRERTDPRAIDRGYRGRLGDRSCRQQVTPQHNNPLVISYMYLVNY